MTLTPGATFGELCLIEPDSKRSATVIVDQQAQMANFIVLTAASYLRMTRSQTIEVRFTALFPTYRAVSELFALLWITTGHDHRQYRVLAAFAYFQELDQDAYDVLSLVSTCQAVALTRCHAMPLEIMHIVNSMKLVNVSAGVRMPNHSTLHSSLPTHSLVAVHSNT